MKIILMREPVGCKRNLKKLVRVRVHNRVQKRGRLRFI